MIAKKMIYDYENRELPIPIFPGFPIEILYQHFSHDTYDYIDWHWHTELQYSLVTHGSIRFHIGNENILRSAGEGIFINSEQIHMAVPEQSDSTFLCISFHPALFEQADGSYLYQNFFRPVLSSPHIRFLCLASRCCCCVREIDRYYRQKKFGYELQITSALLSLWRYTLKELPVLQDKVPDTHTLRENQRLKAILNYIHAHYSEPISLDMIAGHIHLSRSECSRFFQRTTGQNLFQYITRYRINKGAAYLIRTEMSIAQVALETGFGGQSYFTECFKKYKHMTPLAFRRIHAKTAL